MELRVYKIIPTCLRESSVINIEFYASIIITALENGTHIISHI